MLVVNISANTHLVDGARVTIVEHAHAVGQQRASLGLGQVSAPALAQQRDRHVHAWVVVEHRLQWRGTTRWDKKKGQISFIRVGIISVWNVNVNMQIKQAVDGHCWVTKNDEMASQCSNWWDSKKDMTNDWKRYQTQWPADCPRRLCRIGRPSPESWLSTIQIRKNKSILNLQGTSQGRRFPRLMKRQLNHISTTNYTPIPTYQSVSPIAHLLPSFTPATTTWFHSGLVLLRRPYITRDKYAWISDGSSELPSSAP